MPVSRRSKKPEEENNPPPAMDLSKIKDILKIMEDHELSSLEIEQDGFKVKLEKGGLAAPPAHTTAPAAAVAAAPSAPADAISAPDTEEITAPMVGTFYKASSPDTDAFVKVGDAVDVDTTVCIIEAMKVMNEIKAEKKGVIQRILAEDASPVQFGEGLFVIA